jgi:hypothetical protein
MDFLGNASETFGVIEATMTDVDERKAVIEQAASLSKTWPGLEPHRKKAVLQALVYQIEVQRETIILQLRSNRLVDIIDPDADLSTVSLEGDEKPSLTLTIPARFKRAGMETTLLIEGQARREPDRSMLSLLAKARTYHLMVMKGEGQTLKALAKEAGVARSYFTCIFKLSFLAPDIVKAIVDGRHPPDLNAKRLSLDTKLAPAWTDQMSQLGIR